MNTQTEQRQSAPISSAEIADEKNQKISIREAVVVEGKYDRITLEKMLDAVIITTDGYGIFSDKEKLRLLRMLAEKTGLLILTDSDRAGQRIRHYISGAVDSSKIKHAYIPEILGKERRKPHSSGEGKLGVEGMTKTAIISALESAGIFFGEKRASGRKLTKSDMYAYRLTGRPDSYSRRRALLKSLSLPLYLSPNALLTVLNAMMSYERCIELIARNAPDPDI